MESLEEQKQQLTKRLRTLELSLKRLYLRIDEVHDEIDEVKAQLQNFEGGEKSTKNETKHNENKNVAQRKRKRCEQRSRPSFSNHTSKGSKPNPTKPETPQAKTAIPAEPTGPKYTADQKAKSVLVTGTPFCPKPTEPKAQQASPVTNEADPRKKYYVIFNGDNAGIYKDWHIVNSYIQGRAVTHKSYPTYVEAQKAFDESRPTWAKTAAKPPQPNEQIRKMVQLNPRAKDIINNIPTRQSLLEQRKPRANEFTAMWTSIVNWTQDEGAAGFYPTDGVSPKVVFVPGSHPSMVYKYWANGLTNTIYLSENLRELNEFPRKYVEAVANFQKWVAKGKPLFISSFSSYPAFNQDGSLCVPALSIDKVGSFNGDYIPRGEPQYTDLTDELYVYKLCKVYDESRKLTHTKNFKVNYVGANVLLYSLSKKEPSPEVLQYFIKFEEPFLHINGVFKNFSNEEKMMICQEMKGVKEHACPFCTKKEESEDDEIIVDDDECSDANEHLERVMA